LSNLRLDTALEDFFSEGDPSGREECALYIKRRIRPAARALALRGEREKLRTLVPDTTFEYLYSHKMI